jgi:pyruvate kinase
LKLLSAGHKILIDHGKITLKVTDLMGNNFFATVIKGEGELKTNQEIFFPDIFRFLNLKLIPDNDLRDLKFAVDNDVDFILASHVNCGLTIKEIKSHLEGKVKVLAKIQNRYAVDEIGEIF